MPESYLHRKLGQRSQLPPEALTGADVFIAAWRKRRVEFVTPLIACFDAFLHLAVAIALLLLHAPLFLVLTWSVALLGCVITLALSLSRLGLADYAGYPFYLSLWASSTVLIYATGGLFSPFFALFLMKYFLYGITLQSEVRPWLTILFCAANFAAWVACYVFVSSTGKELQLPWPFYACLFIHVIVCTCIAIVLMIYSERLLAADVVKSAGTLAQSRVHLAQMREANEAKRAFLSVMSHEIWTPLSSLLCYADFILEEGLSAEERRIYAETIRRHGSQVNALLKDTIDFANSEEKKRTVEKADVALEPFLRGIISERFDLANAAHLPFKIAIDAGLPGTIKTDPHLLHEVMNRLIDSTLKVQKSEGLSILAEMATSDNMNEPWLRIYVSYYDWEKGPADPEISKRLSKLTANTIYSRPGLGLWTAIARNLILLLKGNIQFESVEKGVTFMINLPYERADDFQDNAQDRAS